MVKQFYPRTFIINYGAIRNEEVTVTEKLYRRHDYPSCKRCVFVYVIADADVQRLIAKYGLKVTGASPPPEASNVVACTCFGSFGRSS